MKLQVYERLAAMEAIAPLEGSLSTLRMVREMSTKLGFSADERKEIGMEEPGNGQVTWDESKTAMGKDIELSENELDVVKKALMKMDHENRLRQNFVSLYEKVVEKKGV